MRIIVIGFAILACIKVWTQDRMYRAIMSDALVQAYRERAHALHDTRVHGELAGHDGRAEVERANERADGAGGSTRLSSGSGVCRCSTIGRPTRLLATMKMVFSTDGDR